MPRRTRKLIGAFTIVGFVVVYAFVAMMVAQAPSIGAAPKLIQTVIYLALGLGWIVPLMPLIRWMERPDDA